VEVVKKTLFDDEDSPRMCEIQHFSAMHDGTMIFPRFDSKNPDDSMPKENG
jgi:hypothetical protein